jgi:hypothetical protein
LWRSGDLVLVILLDLGACDFMPIYTGHHVIATASIVTACQAQATYRE